LKPFGQFGAGKDTACGDVNYSYGGGSGSLLSFHWHKFVFGIGNSLILARDRNAATNESNGFSMLEAGLDVRHPLGIKLYNRDLDVGVFLVVSRFFNRVDFLEDEGQTERINLIYTAGLTMGSEKAVSLWKLDFDRVGIDYRWGMPVFRELDLIWDFRFSNNEFREDIPAKPGSFLNLPQHEIRINRREAISNEFELALLPENSRQIQLVSEWSLVQILGDDIFRKVPAPSFWQYFQIGFFGLLDLDYNYKNKQ